MFLTVVLEIASPRATDESLFKVSLLSQLLSTVIAPSFICMCIICSV